MKPFIFLIAAIAIMCGVYVVTTKPAADDPITDTNSDPTSASPTDIPTPELPARPTFTQHIAPLIYDQCVACHRPGQVAPFSLISYDDAKKRAQQLVEVTQSRYMPPFLPDASLTRFRNSRHLHDNQLELLKRWAEQGCVEGDQQHMPAMPQFSSDWQLGEPDLKVSMDREYTLPPEGQNVFRQFVVPIPTEKLKYVQGFEFRTTNPRIVHHARFLFDSTQESRILDEADPEPGFASGMGTGASRDPEGHWLGWTPGKQPVMREEKYAWPLPPKIDLVIELHMLPTGKPEPIKCELGFFYADKPPTNLPVIIRMGPTTIDIPPNEKEYVHAEQFQIPVDVDMLNVYPHAHLLAKTMQSYATLPDGKRQCLIKIDEWDFNWQDEYQFAEPIRLPAGTTIDMQFTFDNSEDNIRNPHSPPRRVLQGSETSDEMGDLWFQMVPVNPETRTMLSNAIYRREAVWVVREMKFLAEERPSAKTLTNWAMILQTQRRPADARDVLKRAVKMEPGSPVVLNSLAVAEMSLGNFSEAARLLETVLSTSEASPNAIKNLGFVRIKQKKFADAIPLLRKAVKTSPKDARSWMGLATAYAETGESKAARQCADYVLKLDPTSRPAMDLRVRLQSKRKSK
jgi:tetratricopeptide (TPR) repeat protein